MLDAFKAELPDGIDVPDDEELLPHLDQGLSALLDDLNQRGLLRETLVSVFGEFGRTPKINSKAGRDHWGLCRSAVMAGGGVQDSSFHRIS